VNCIISMMSVLGLLDTFEVIEREKSAFKRPAAESFLTIELSTYILADSTKSGLVHHVKR
jgi:hypothetical protein